MYVVIAGGQQQRKARVAGADIVFSVGGVLPWTAEGATSGGGGGVLQPSLDNFENLWLLKCIFGVTETLCQNGQIFKSGKIQIYLTLVRHERIVWCSSVRAGVRGACVGGSNCH
jgi:hypothetical protein